MLAFYDRVSTERERVVRVVTGTRWSFTERHRTGKLKRLSLHSRFILQRLIVSDRRFNTRLTPVPEHPFAAGADGRGAERPGHRRRPGRGAGLRLPRGSCRREARSDLRWARATSGHGLHALPPAYR